MKNAVMHTIISQVVIIQRENMKFLGNFTKKVKMRKGTMVSV